MSAFFRAGGAGMFPTLLFGFLTVAAAVLVALRPERRYVLLLANLGVTTAFAGTLGTCLGVSRCFHYVVLGVPGAADQLTIALGCVEESLSNLILACVLVIISALIALIGSLRAMRTRTAER